MHLYIGFHFRGISNAVKHNKVNILFPQKFTGSLKFRRIAVWRGGDNLRIVNIVFPFHPALRYLLRLGRNHGDSGARCKRRDNSIENITWED